jgi:Interferon-induced transmembrane protein/TIR domain
MSGTIFINYRKDDSSWNALALYNELQKYFPKESIFKDFNTIRPGDDFVESIQKALSHCNVLLIVMSKNWLQVKDKHGNRRLDDPDDLVRIEISTAIERHIQVIPVLFDNIPMPTSADLPDNLRSLPRRQYVEIETTRFESDVKKLAEAIKELLPAEEPTFTKKEVHAETAGPKPAQRASQQNVPKSQHENIHQFHGNTNPPGTKPDNYLVFAIITTIICCLPLGIVSIIHSTKVDNLWNAGRYEDAQTASKQAKQFAIYAAIAGVIVIGLYLLLVVAGSIGY